MRTFVLGKPVSEDQRARGSASGGSMLTLPRRSLKNGGASAVSRPSARPGSSALSHRESLLGS